MNLMMKDQYRPFWVEPSHLKKLGYKLVSDKDGYLKYKSLFKLGAFHRKGRKFEQPLWDGKRIIYFNLTFSSEENLVFCNIREDADTRTVYNGIIDSEDKLEWLLNSVE